MAETKTTTSKATTTTKAAPKTAKATTTTKTAAPKAATTKKVSSTKVAAPKAEVKEEVKVVEKEVKATKVAQKQLKVTLVRSTIGYNRKQARVVEALGLGKLNSSHVLPDNPCVRGMIFRVKHLVKVEELN